MDENETITNCPMCGKHCPIDAPHCERGQIIAEKLKSGDQVEINANRKERGGKGRHRHRQEDHRRHK